MSKKATEKRIALPGDILASPEEFMSGRNTYEQGGHIRATLPGQVEKDLAKREIAVRPAVTAKTPKVGDMVFGQVEAAMTSTAGVRITYINGHETKAGFPGTIFTRSERGGRGERRTAVTRGDVVRARVTSTMNGTNQLSIDEPHLGVVASLCTVCGTLLRPVGDRVRCEVCGSVEDRKYADDFGRADVKP